MILNFPNGKYTGTQLSDDRIYYAYIKNHKFHNEKGPAIFYSNGIVEWRIENMLHNVNGPARIWSCGREEWWLNGVPHREDGPAFDESKNKYWYYQGVQIHCKSQEEFERWLRKEKLKSFL